MKRLAVCVFLALVLFPTVCHAADLYVVMPHADDEALFAGQTIAGAIARGDRVHVIFTTDCGNTAAWRRQNPKFLRDRQNNARATLTALGVREVIFLSVRDSHYSEYAAATQMSAGLKPYKGVLASNPVITISPTGHSDHKATFSAVTWLLRSARVDSKRYPRKPVIAWGYDSAGKAITKPTIGKSLKSVGSVEAKTKHILAYKKFFTMFYPRKLITLFDTQLGKPDVLSQ